MDEILIKKTRHKKSSQKNFMGTILQGAFFRGAFFPGAFFLESIEPLSNNIRFINAFYI